MPDEFVTVRAPVVAPLGTVAEIDVFELTVNTALRPLNRTNVVPAKSFPLIAITVPGEPTFGEKTEMLGTTWGAAFVGDGTLGAHGSGSKTSVFA